MEAGQRLDASTAQALGLIANEAVTNALKYAFPSGRPGMVRMVLARDGSEAVMRIEDNGIGLAACPRLERNGAGMLLVRRLASQIGGAVTVGAGGDGVGTVLTVAFPHSADSDCRAAGG